MISETQAQTFLPASSLAYIDNPPTGPVGYEVVRERTYKQETKEGQILYRA
jgi:hypothetical protein